MDVRRPGAVKVWIDFSNSPHHPLVRARAATLGDEGHEVLITARDNAQTMELAQSVARGRGDSAVASPRARAAKWRRRSGVIQTSDTGRPTRPHVRALDNSYAQIVAARSLRIPSVTAMDFEHQPANNLAFRLARLSLYPMCSRSTPSGGRAPRTESCATPG